MISDKIPSDSSLMVSDIGGATFGYTPTPDGNGIDANVTDIRIKPKGVFLPSSGAGNPGFNIVFRIRVDQESVEKASCGTIRRKKSAPNARQKKAPLGERGFSESGGRSDSLHYPVSVGTRNLTVRNVYARTRNHR